MGKERKKKSKQKYELERRQIELEEELLDIQQKRLELEQRRVELQLKKVRLAMRKPKRQSAPPIVISNDSLNARSDDESSFLTAPTVSTQNEFSDHSGDAAVRYPSQRFSGGESDGEEPCPPKADPRRRFSEAKRSSSGGEASAAVSEPVVPSDDVKPASLRQRSSSDTQTLHTHAHDGKFQSSAKRAVQSMRNLVSTPKPSLEASERSASLRDLLAETHANAASLLHDSCSRSEQTIDSSKTKVTSNVSDHKNSFDRGRSYPSLTEERKSNRKLAAGDLQNGEFVYEWPDGRRYEGSWKDGKVRCIHLLVRTT
jgi:hypothetical protein